MYVIDSCFAKQQAYNPLTGLESLLVAPISKASAAQRAGMQCYMLQTRTLLPILFPPILLARQFSLPANSFPPILSCHNMGLLTAGRAGRVRPGLCFRLCTEEDFKALPDSSVPEMQRCELASTVLQLKAMGIDNIMKFDWLAPPPAETMIRALELLHALGALGDDARQACCAPYPAYTLVLKALQYWAASKYKRRCYGAQWLLLWPFNKACGTALACGSLDSQ